MQTLTIRTPDDWHLHFRDGDMLQETVPATARCFARAIVMPNLVPPVTTAGMAMDYKQRILDARPKDSQFEPLMTLYLTNTTTPDDIAQAKAAGVVACKLYPAGATTNSDAAVTGIEALYPVFEAMREHGLLLLIHGEADNNSGTYPMQIERYFNALKGLGATARLVMLPKESHGYSAKESVLHVLWEQDQWLEKYVKNKEKNSVEVPQEDFGN